MQKANPSPPKPLIPARLESNFLSVDDNYITYDYGLTVGGMNNSLISRIDRIHLDGSASTGAIYHHVGMNMFSHVDYPEPDVQLDRSALHTGERRWGATPTGTAGVYPGWDRFGRLQRQMWVDGAFDDNTSSSTEPNRPPIVELTHKYDVASNRITRVDERTGAGYDDKDYHYLYDGLDRLIETKRGVGDDTSMVLAEGSQQWTLDMLGNWTDLDTDTATPLGTYDSSDHNEDRTHNEANEIVDYVLNGGTAMDYTYDKAGNLREKEIESPGLPVTWTYTHDAWNRLVKVETATNTTRSEFQYNGLHWRTVKRDDSDTTPDGTVDQERHYYYNANWQLIEERIDTDLDDDEEIRAQQIWGVRYIDDAVARRIDANADGDYGDTNDKTYYYLTDSQFSVVAVLRSGGALHERIEYDAYGQARHHWPTDLDGDGDGSDSGDIAVFNGISKPKTISQTGYNADCDFDRDGDVDSADLTAANALYGTSVITALPAGFISDPDTIDSPIGYDGYVHNYSTNLYTVRHRQYDPRQGRWLERDPKSYQDSLNTYLYVQGRPALFIDALGFGPIAWYVDKCRQALGLPRQHTPILDAWEEGFAEGAKDGACGVGEGLVEVPLIIVDGAGLTADTISTYAGYSLDYEPLSQSGTSAVTCDDACAETLNRVKGTALSVGTLGIYPVYQASKEYAETGDGRAFARAMGQTSYCYATCAAIGAAAPARTSVGLTRGRGPSGTHVIYGVRNRGCPRTAWYEQPIPRYTSQRSCGPPLIRCFEIPATNPLAVTQFGQSGIVTLNCASAAAQGVARGSCTPILGLGYGAAIGANDGE